MGRKGSDANGATRPRVWVVSGHTMLRTKFSGSQSTTGAAGAHWAEATNSKTNLATGVVVLRLCDPSAFHGTQSLLAVLLGSNK
jgi:hypothetical protein